MHSFLLLFLATIFVFLICSGGNQVSDSLHRVISTVIKASHGHQTLPSRQIKRAIYHGDEERLRRVLHKAYSGKEILISAIGGSVTNGQGGINKTLRYTERLQRWADDAGLKVKVHNGGFPAINSKYLSSCLNLHSPISSDIVIVELALNDGWSYDSSKDTKIAFERLIRKILARESKPAVLLINAFQHHINVPSEQQSNLYLYNAEAFFFDVGSFYGLQLCSVKAAVWPLIRGRQKGFWVNSTVWNEQQKGINDVAPFYLFQDNIHFTAENGHRAMFELVLGTLLHASRRMLAHSHPEIDNDQDDVWPRLPDYAIFQENAVDFSSAAEMCLVGEPLRQAAVVGTIRGFEWINEAAAKNGSKWGFTSLEMDSELSIKMSTMVEGGSSTRAVSVAVGHLKSYDEKMGTFAIQCSGGCVCDKQVIDGYDPSRRDSQLTMHKFLVTQSPSCIFIISTQAATTGNVRGHKVKIGALVLDGGSGSWQEGGVMETMVEAVSSTTR